MSTTDVRLGKNTIKRLLGLLNDGERQARQSTLNTLGKYLGFSSWSSLLESIGSKDSGFDIMEDEVLSSTLRQGQTVTITFSPDREVCFTYKGNGVYGVSKSVNSKLCIGDVVCINAFILKFPLFATNVTRDGRSMGNYTAARVDGIATIEVS